MFNIGYVRCVEPTTATYFIDVPAPLPHRYNARLPPEKRCRVVSWLICDFKFLISFWNIRFIKFKKMAELSRIRRESSQRINFADSRYSYGDIARDTAISVKPAERAAKLFAGQLRTRKIILL
ncbi:hypothetical protein EVAR_33356_1 [Eumeta japonica]|uniref:Uncharacterized protein n=1 Tax=Eumeta variegata TaxID=151549 RepID=A0A4C1YIV4_EUMVA|nr:hypothetical protein EVAR_33356_1 [Eumeta japonica]